MRDLYIVLELFAPIYSVCDVVIPVRGLYSRMCPTGGDVCAQTHVPCPFNNILNIFTDQNDLP